MPTPTEIMNRFIDEYQTGGNEAVAEQLLAPGFVDHTPFPGFGNSRHDVIQLFRVLRAAFPDLRAEVVEQFENANRVATRKTFHGTHEGEFAGIPATHRKVQIRVMDILHIQDGQLHEHWNVVDVAGLMRQLTE
ncbi:MAG: ester cyclase [Bryobacterales bacterium]|nr:ester cyclase [Bryobacterales bacterium]